MTPTPFGGLSTVIHLSINLLFFIFKLIKPVAKIVIPVLVAIIVIGVVGFAWEKIFSASLDTDNNIENIRYTFTKCTPYGYTKHDNKVILRLDDIRSYIYTESTVKLVSEAERRKIHMVLGLIPSEIGRDKIINRLIKSTDCNMEIAMHGWNHGLPNPDKMPFEFEDIDEKDANTRIEKGLEILKRYTNNTIATFVPPGNRLSDGAKKAIEQHKNIKYISDSESGKDHVSVATYDFNKYKLLEAKTVLSACDKAFEQKKLCIIILHPQDYMVKGKYDENNYRQFIEILDGLQIRNVEYTTFQRFYK